MKRYTVLLVVVVPLVAIALQATLSERPVTPAVLLTLYSPHGPRMLEVPGRKSWCGWLWIDHHKIGRILPGQFLTLKLPEGDHSVAGEAFFARESTLQTTLASHSGTRYFMRLVIESKAVAGFGPTRWTAEEVTCKEAYREAATLEPIKLKRIERSFLDDIARETYFPECDD